MTPWQAWLSAWKAVPSTRLEEPCVLPEVPEDLLSLGLLLAGLADAATLRQARLLSAGHPRFKFLLLCALVRLRQGRPRSTAAELCELAQPLEILPEHGRMLDPAALRAAQAAAFPALRQELSKLCQELSEDPHALAPLTGTRDQDPKPLLCVDTEGSEMTLGFARHEAATDGLLADLAVRCGTSATGIDLERAAALVAAVDPRSALHDAQRAAVRKALEERFVVLTGGPGTGKTTVVACLLWALLESDLSLHPERIVLCAPTGRAQARLSESVAANLVRLKEQGIPLSPAQGELSRCASSTLHTLLGARPDGSFRHHAGNRLPHRVVVVDEASMIDLGMFAALLAAVPQTAHLILVGDPDQLPSVEAGAVLSDLMASPSLAVHRTSLSFTWRNQGRIAACSRSLNDGSWSSELAPFLSLEAWISGEGREEGSVHHLVGPLEALLDHWTERWFETPNFGRILCATHGGPSGRETVNHACDERLRQRTGKKGVFLPGQPVILGKNHPEHDLWNGDLGRIEERYGELWAVFDAVFIRAGELAGLESAWAITVHKSQGSEFPEVLFLLPERDTPLLTRQIAYTAITRARQSVLLWGDPKMLSLAASRKEDRPSRLRRF